VGSSSENDIESVKEEFRQMWDLEGVDERELLLGITVKKMDSGDIWLTQGAYFKKLLQHFNLWEIYPVGTPLIPGAKIYVRTSSLSQAEIEFMSNKPYHSLLSGILWGSSGTQLDLAHATGVLARMQSLPGPEHWNTLIGVCRYIKGMLDYGILLHKPSSSEITTPGADLLPLGYVDSDWAGCTDT
jgi:hypothetical protein